MTFKELRLAYRLRRMELQKEKASHADLATLERFHMRSARNLAFGEDGDQPAFFEFQASIARHTFTSPPVRSAEQPLPGVK